MDAFYRQLVGAALFAYSPQNTQPWRFRVEGGRLLAGLDPERVLAAADPLWRRAWVSLGCAVENARLVALASRVTPVVSFRPDSAWPAEIAFDPRPPPARTDVELEPLIRLRRTCRGRMAATALTAAARTSAARSALPEARLREISPRDRVALLDIVQWSISVQLSMPRARDDLHRWHRFWPWQARRAHDGLTVRDLGLTGWRGRLAPVLLSRAVAGAAGMPQRLARQARRVAAPSAALFLVVTERDDPTGWFQGGRGFQRSVLAFTRAGYATHALGAPLDIPDSLAVVREIFGVAPTEGVVALVRVGRPAGELNAAPRRHIDDLFA